MAVNPEPLGALTPVGGVSLSTAAAGIRYKGRDDLLLIQLAEGTTGAAVFTRNAFFAAPVGISRQRFRSTPQVRAVLVNSGNANAGTGSAGEQAALQCSTALAQALAVDEQQLWLASTGVIGECLPATKVISALPDLVSGLQADAWQHAAKAIMTTDQTAKGLSRQIEVDGCQITVTGIAKGAGMIRPDMATMLAFVATDAAVPAAVLQQMLERANAESFSCISVDGDTSTNDCCYLFATGAAGNTALSDTALQALEQAITEVCIHLARSIVRDGEGATHVADIQIEGARSAAEARQVADTIAHSPLVKTAMFAADPNWGRILAAVGRSGLEDLDTAGIDIWLDDVRILQSGEPDPDYRDDMGKAVMQRPEYRIRVLLGRGNARAHLWTCDFGHDYVKINAEYRS